jgi:hypothetical protein
VDSSAGSWENYFVVDDCMDITNLFLLNIFLKLLDFILNVCVFNENSGCLNTRQLAVDIYVISSVIKQ